MINRLSYEQMRHVAQSAVEKETMEEVEELIKNSIGKE